jgi:3-hydroxyisobutyrate dehydrogenase-like beta-hydroxyacid dehydrogenase
MPGKNDVSPQIGWVGLGSVGSRMARYRPQPAFSSRCARPSGSADAIGACSKSDAIFSIVPDDDAFLDIVRAARDNAKLGSCLIDMNTVSPDAWYYRVRS